VDKSSIIRAFSFVLGVALILAVSWGAFKAVSDAKAEPVPQNNSATLDNDSSLALVIDSLEASWNRRINYRFGVAQDPLYLGRTIVGFSYNRAGYKEIEEDTEFRLSATVVDVHPKAIIKYQGKSKVVQVGDMVGDGYYVRDIQAKEVTLVRGGQPIVLKNKGLPTPMDELAPSAVDNQPPVDNPEQY
jgi:hypothetical protein